MIIELIRNFDLFGYPVELAFKNKHSHITFLGGFISFIFLFLFTIFTFVTSYQLFTFQSITSVKQVHNQKMGGYGRLDLNTNNFMFAFKFTQDHWNKWSEHLMPMKLYNSHQIRNNSGNFQIDNPIQLENCTLDHFYSLEKDFRDFNLHEALCPIKNTNFVLQGGSDENIFNSIKLSLFSCENSSTCQKAQNKSQTYPSNLGIDKFSYL